MKTHAEWPARRFDQLNRDAIDTRRAEPVSACTGNCAQGRSCNCAPKPAECCTEIGADGTQSIWESADAEVMAFCGRICIVLLTASVAVFSGLLLMGALNAWLASLA
jgi:hypothetical protein